jgi:hypothetical protein
MASRGSSGTRGLHCRRCGIHSVTGQCFIQPLPLAESVMAAGGFYITVLLSLAVLGSSTCKTSDPRSGADHHAEALQPLLLLHACRFRGLGLLRGRRVSLAARLGSASVTVLDLRSRQRTPTSNSRRRAGPLADRCAGPRRVTYQHGDYAPGVRPGSLAADRER